ncbi:hypothetical protein [Oceanococcus atlanticus]|uniref:hypothetical protein n=1 Tax=Oceanococcus atlanticus TaxID=1317117 RepID=UPI0038B35580
MAWRQLRPSQPEPPSDAFEPMLKCCICEAHVPRAQAIDIEGKTYCREHAPTGT